MMSDLTSFWLVLWNTLISKDWGGEPMKIREAKGYEFDPRIRCGYCGASSRRVFALPKGQKATHQRPGTWKCQRGHQTRRKLV